MRKSSAHKVTTADLLVLSLLAERPMHGYELNRELETREVRDWAEISRPQVYYSLNKLAQAGLIRPIAAALARSGPERQVYTLSHRGHAALCAGLAEEHWAQARPPPPFLTWMAMSPHARAQDVATMIARRRAFLTRESERERATLEELENGEGPMASPARLMVRLTIRQFEIELEWLDEVERELTRAPSTSD